MAKLISALKIHGTVDDLTFRRTVDGIIVQSKPGPRPGQVRKGKNFIRTRQNYQEFGHVSKDASLLRRALGNLVRAVMHPHLNGHTISMMHQVKMSDQESLLGERSVNMGNIQLLEGFNYNNLLRFDDALPVAIEQAMDAATGKMRVVVPSCLLRHKRTFPKEATHCRIVSCASMIDLKKRTADQSIVHSELLPLRKQMPAIDLCNHIFAKPGQVMLHIAGIVFFRVDNGREVILRGGALQVMQVAKVMEKAANGNPNGTESDSRSLWQEHGSEMVTNHECKILTSPHLFFIEEVPL